MKPQGLEHMPFVVDDGGRAAAGYRKRGDCVTRAIAVASGRPYREVYDTLSAACRAERRSKHDVRSGRAGKVNASNGVHTTRKWFKDQMRAWGFTWVPTMGIGTGCCVHLVKGELPAGRLVVSVSKHYTAVIDGVVHDTGDPQRRTYRFDAGGLLCDISERCVYGYWMFTKQ